MQNHAALETADQSPPPWRWEWLLVSVSFALFATIRAPIPGVNEPHFLSKAKHFWDPGWCAGDPFLQSANAHYVFYATFGLLTRAFTLEQTAWIGRVIGWGLLASGWSAVTSRLSTTRWFGLWSAWVFLGLAAIGNWSGEWVVGGIEAKVISYACAWWSLASVLRGHLIRGGAWAGAAVSFHPVVGIWHTGAVFLAILFGEKIRRGGLNSNDAADAQDGRVASTTNNVNARFHNVRQLCRKLFFAGLLWILLAGPGLIPALDMIRGANPNQAYAADFIQVFHRLNHHLDPFRFQSTAYLHYGIMIATIIGLRIFTRPTPVSKLLFRYAMIAVTIALAGLLVRSLPRIASWLLDLKMLPGWNDRLKFVISRENHLAKWLKFYPFRLADVAVPLVLAMQLTQLWFSRRGSKNPPIGQSDQSSTNRYHTLLPTAIFGAIFVVSLIASWNSARQDSRLATEMFPDWRDVCHWVRRETPADAFVYVPSQGFGVKWYAERAEYVSFKDCPQDAAGIVAWNDRLRLMDRWSKQHQNGEYPIQKVQELRRSTGLDYIIVPVQNSKLARLPLVPVYQNPHYMVLRLSDVDVPK